MTELRSPRPPLDPIRGSRWLLRLAGDVIDEYRKDDVGDVAASITFWTLLSIPAAVLALVSALGSLGSIVGTEVADDVEREVQDFVTRTFADDSATISDAVTELFQASSSGLFTVALAVALFTLSRGFAGLIRALDRVYEVDDSRSWLGLRLVALALGLGTVTFAAAGATMLAVLPALPGGALLRWLAVPLVLLVMVLWSATLYHVGPHHRTPWRYDIPGAIVTTLGWAAASQGFALYVRVADRGNQVQTTVGAVLLAFTLLYALSVVLLIGAEVNDVIARRAGVVQRPPDRSLRVPRSLIPGRRSRR